MLGHFGALKLKQSPVLGELAVGIIVGALAYQLSAPTATILRHFDQINVATQKVLVGDVGWKKAMSLTLAEADLSPEEKAQIEAVAHSPKFPQYLLLARILHFFSSFGIVLLLFMAGLESSLDKLKRSGSAAVGLGLSEVSLTFGCCYSVVWLLLPGGRNLTIPLVVAGALCATSVGISARVFQDMGRLDLPEAQVVLGAAILDDILGLIILAVVTGILTSGAVGLSTIALIVLKAVLFFAAVVWFGLRFLQKDIAFFARLRPEPCEALLFLLPLAALRLAGGSDGSGHHHRGLCRGADSGGSLFPVRQVHSGGDAVGGVAPGPSGTDLRTAVLSCCWAFRWTSPPLPTPRSWWAACCSPWWPCSAKWPPPSS